MRPLSIRVSLIAWFVGSTMLLLVSFSVTLYLSIDHALRASLDAQLQAQAQTLAALCDWDDETSAVEFDLSPELAAEFRARVSGCGLDVRTWPAQGLLCQLGQPLPPVTASTPDGALPPSTRLMSFSDSEPRRLCAVLATIPAVAESATEPAAPAFSVLVRVTQSLRPLQLQMQRVSWLILMLVAGALVVVLAFGWFLSRRVVRPLDRLGKAAAAVSPGGDARMPRHGSGDEVDQLADILDATFASLKESLARQARFTADAAHELRNPISVIRNAAAVALRQERSGEEYRAFLADVLVTSRRMGGIVEALLLLARMDAGVVRGRFASVNLLAIASESRDAFAEQRSRVRLKNGTGAMVRGEAGLLRVLTDNLLSNALRYSPEDQPVDVTVRQDDRGIALSVRDFGPGVSEATRALMFERFFRGEAAPLDPAGAGLGLAIVAEVARLHAAACDVENAAPGTRVTVWFPASEIGDRNAT
ncbi:MAG: histidine kinase dimerization/phospho-acceptor domain-containing protein [Planctomycetota bacterium]